MGGRLARYSSDCKIAMAAAPVNAQFWENRGMGGIAGGMRLPWFSKMRKCLIERHI
jgi:hypothetical protein